jgi:hypothetical protein
MLNMLIKSALTHALLLVICSKACRKKFKKNAYHALIPSKIKYKLLENRISN